MPYTIDDDNCVHKENDDGTMGAIIEGGCHDTREEALAHLQALEAATADEEKGQPLSLDEAMKTERTYFTAGSLKMLDAAKSRVGGYLVVWGGPQQRDSQGEYFTPSTDFALDWYNKRPVLYHHGLADMRGEDIGFIDTIRPDDKGLWAEAELDDSKTSAKNILQLVESGKLGWSSGSVPHLVETTLDGEIRKWPIVEGSLTPSPAEPERTTVARLKAAMDCCSIEKSEPVPDDTTVTSEEPPAKETRPPRKAREHRNKRRKNNTGGYDMRQDMSMLMNALEDNGIESDKILAILRELDAGGEQEMPDDMRANDERDDLDAMRSQGTMQEIKTLLQSLQQNNNNGNGNGAKSNNGLPKTQEEFNDAIKAAIEQHERTAPPKDDGLPGRSSQDGEPGHATKAGGGIRVRVSSKYDKLSWKDMAFMKSVLDAKSKSGDWQPSEPEKFYRAAAEKATKADREWEPGAANVLKAIKSDELNYSTQSGFGDELVPEMWRADLWETPRLDNFVQQNTTFIEMPSDPYRVPIEGSDPTVYAVSETTDASELVYTDSGPFTSSKVGTNNDTLSAGKLGVYIRISQELVEDGIIPIIPEWRRKAVRVMQDAIDNVFLNADATTGTSNINLDGGTITSTNKVLYGGGDGFLHIPLVDATGQSVDMGNVAPTLLKIREARNKLSNARKSRISELAYYCDPSTEMALLSLDEALNMQVNGRQSTFNDGRLGNIDGIPVYVTDEMELAASNGQISNSSANNTRGRLLLVHQPSWIAGYRRNVSVNVTYVPAFDAHLLTVSARVALLNQSTDCVSLLYNIAV